MSRPYCVTVLSSDITTDLSNEAQKHFPILLEWIESQ